MTRRPRSGFAAVDAIVALTLIGLTLGLCLQLGVMANRSSKTAAELRRVTALGRYALAGDDTPRSGQDGAVAWQLDIVRERAEGLTVCRKRFSAKGSEGRRYSWQTMTPCPATEDLP